MVLSGCHPLSVSNHTKTETIVESPTAQTENSDLNYEQFSLAEIKKEDLFKELLEEARKIAPSDIISDSIDYVVYHFEYKNHTPNISWYDKNGQELEYYYVFDGITRYIHTENYLDDSLPRNNSNGDYLEYRPPISEMDDSCLYDKNNRVITEFSNAVNKSSEVSEIRYNPNGTISRKSYIEIDYYDIDWRALEEDSEFSVDRADEAFFESVHLDYTFDDYIYDSNDLLVRIDSYKAGANNPYHYEVFEYDDDNRVTRSYSGRYDDDFIFWIDFYFYN